MEMFHSGIIVFLGVYLVTKGWVNQQQHIGRLVVMPPLLFLLYLHFADLLQFLALMMF